MVVDGMDKELEYKSLMKAAREHEHRRDELNGVVVGLKERRDELNKKIGGFADEMSRLYNLDIDGVSVNGLKKRFREVEVEHMTGVFDVVGERRLISEMKTLKRRIERCEAYLVEHMGLGVLVEDMRGCRLEHDALNLMVLDLSDEACVEHEAMVLAYEGAKLLKQPK